MKHLVETDLEDLARRVLARVDDDVRAPLRAWLARPREVSAEDLVEILELSESDVLASLARFRDARVLAGQSPEALRAELERIRTFFERCEEEGHLHFDLDELVASATPPPRAPIDPHASRQALLEHLMADTYTSTVVRRLLGLPGVIATQVFLRELVALDLRPEDEPRVARLVASLNTVVEAHHEVIDALRKK